MSEMKKDNNNQQGLSGNLKCIWMTSKLVDYKLCDREFDCENCEFDKVFRNLSTKSGKNLEAYYSNNNDLLENVIKKIEDQIFDEKLIYLKNQIILKNLFGNAYYLGINPTLILLLEDINSFKENAANDIKKEQVIFTLEGNWGKREFISPINFLTLGKISVHPNKINQNQWNYIILFNSEQLNNIQLTKGEWLVQKNNAICFLRNQMNSKPIIGESLMDGGEKVQYLYQYLGHQKYLKLVNEVLR
jgi:hypothetical protein